MSGSLNKKSHKWLIGCSITCAVVLLLVSAVAWWCYNLIFEKVDKMSREFIDSGYEKIVGQRLDVIKSSEKPTLYIGQLVYINADQQFDVAIIAQVAEVSGNIEGKLSFRGQVLVVHKDAIVNKLDVTAQTVKIYGEVSNPITGTYQELDQEETSIASDMLSLLREEKAGE